MQTDDERYMQAALRLARRGLGAVEPNPAVGCIIVKGNQVAGRGWHKKFGGPHAEINAIEDCKTLGIDPAGSTIYVTLEPCCHHGKTPPCTDAIIAARPARVVVATIDPSPHAGGAGIEQLRHAGIQVDIGLCQTQARLLNAPFFKFAATGDCWVTLKWAQSIDGKLAPAPGEGSTWLSNELSRKDVQHLRRRVQAILVGINTVLADDPLLIPRPARGKKLIRIVLDNHLRTPPDCQLLRTISKSPVLVLTSAEAVRLNPAAAESLTGKGADLLVYDDRAGQSNLRFLMQWLREHCIAHLLVEGGPTVLASFIKENLVDEICVYVAPKILAAGGTADLAAALAQIDEAMTLHHVQIKQFGEDVCMTGLSEKAAAALSLA